MKNNSAPPAPPADPGRKDEPRAAAGTPPPVSEQLLDRFWWLVVGAMLANRSFAGLACQILPEDDIPPPLRPLWQAIAAKRHEAVYQLLGLEPASGRSVLDAVLQAIQQHLLRQRIKSSFHKAQWAHLLDARDAASKLEQLASEIRVRLAKMEPLKTAPSPQSPVPSP